MIFTLTPTTKLITKRNEFRDLVSGLYYRNQLVSIASTTPTGDVFQDLRAILKIVLQEGVPDWTESPECASLYVEHVFDPMAGAWN